MCPSKASGLLLVASAFGQTTTGSLHGFVSDPSGTAIAGAEVTTTSTERRLVRSTVSDAAGLWRLEGLSPSRYVVTASASNFQKTSFTDVLVTVDSRTRLDFRMTLGSRQETIEVGAPAGAMDAESAALGLTLDRARIQDLPLNRRDFLQLALLAPGVLPPVQDSELSSRGSFAMHAGGAREEFNNFTLDGADNNDAYTNRYVLQPPVDSIREFKVLTGSYSAEYGRGGGGQVNVITRSGGNAWHGSGYEYLRNRVLDARNFFDGRDKSGYTRNQFGGVAGGPLLKDRTFAFTGYDALRERRGLTRLATVPTAAERSGDLSAAGRTILDPFTRQPFPGNRVPAARITPLSARVLDLFPLPDRPGVSGNLLSQPKLTDTFDQFLTRLDHRLSAASDLTIRLGYGRDDLLEPFAEDSTDLPGFGNFVVNTGHNIAAQHQRVLGPRAVQTVRFSYGRSFRRALQQNHAVNAGTLWGVPWLNVRPRDYGFPSIKVAGYSVAGDVDQLPLERTTETWQAHYGLSLARGPHALRLGGEMRRFAIDGFLDYFSRGSLTFSGALAGAGIADLLLGLPSFGIQSQFDNRQSLRTSAWNGYLQDDWRVRRNFSISLGLRYEYNTPPTDPEDRMYALDVARGGLAQVGRGGVSRSGLQGDRNNLAPRVGFAWTPRESWSIRGGYGLYYDAGMLVVNSSLYFNPPLFNVRVFFPTQTSLLTLANPFPTQGGITPPPSPNTLSPDITTASLQHWSFTIERRLGASTSTTLAYAGSKGTHLIRSRDLNQPRPGAGPVASRRAMPAFAGVFFIESGGNSSFQSLETLVDRRLARGWSLLAGYTLSKSIDDTSAFLGTRPDKNFPQDSGNYRLERGLSSFDMRHRFTAAPVWEIRSRHWSLRDTSVRAIAVVQAGQPFTPLLRFDNSNTGNSGGIFGSDRPNLLRNPRLAARAPDRWFDPSAFAIPAPFTFGSAGRNVVTGPGQFAIDFGFARRFRLNETWSLVFDAQAFNLLNRARFDLPERFADEPATFGRIFSAKAPRQVQVALRLAF